MAAGNRFCGVRPSSNYNIYSCGMVRKECKRDGAIWPNCLAIPNSTIPPPPPSGLSHASDSKALLASLDDQGHLHMGEIQHAFRASLHSKLP